MQKKFLGYHSEWNLGSPGGWDYQRMAQEIGSFAWDRIKKASGITIDLDFDAPILNPLPLFAEMLLRAHKKTFGKEKPFIVLVAEEETLEKVGENIHIIKYLNGLEGVEAALTDPTKLELVNGDTYFKGKRVTTIFMDFNNRVIVKPRKKHNLDALIQAIKNGIVINPRGMEPVGSKGVFEAITLEFRELMSQTTLQRTPWTRQFYPRSTSGHNGKSIPDLIKWTEDNWENIILKPVHGYSGQGIIIGFKNPDKKKGIKQALDAGDYIIQAIVPTDIWVETFPWIDKENKKIFLKEWQTDFRCFVTDAGILGFVTRFGGIPTNVGTGGGVQSTAILRSDMPLKEAVEKINEVILTLGFEFICNLQEEIDKKSIEIGNIYLLGPIMSTLRPRVLTISHIEQIKTYGQNLWKDALLLEKLWLEGKLSRYVQISKEEEEIARLAPWGGSTALMASDGLFGFVK